MLDFDGINNYDLMYGIPMEDDKKVLGDTYLTTQWQKSTVLLNNEKLLEGYLIRYDISSNELEIKTSKGIKALPGRLVKSFITLDSLTQALKYFVSAITFQEREGGVMDGFFQVLADGTIPW